MLCKQGCLLCFCLRLKLSCWIVNIAFKTKRDATYIKNGLIVCKGNNDNNEVISIKFKQLCNACKQNTLVKKKNQGLHLAILHDRRHLKLGNSLEIHKQVLLTTTTKKGEKN